MVFANIFRKFDHFSDAIMNEMASQITGISIVYSTVCSGTDQRKHQSSVSLAFMTGTHRWHVNSPHKRPVTWKMFPFDDVIMNKTGLDPIWHRKLIEILANLPKIVFGTSEPWMSSLFYVYIYSVSKIREIFTSPTYKLLLSCTVISDLYRYLFQI